MTKREHYPMAQYTCEEKGHTFVVLSETFDRTVPVAVNCPICNTKDIVATLDKEVTKNVRLMLQPKKMKKTETGTTTKRTHKEVHEDMIRKTALVSEMKKKRGMK